MSSTNKNLKLRILYGVSSVGMGHARRSVAIARKIRELNSSSDLAVDFVAAEPVLTFLRESGERILDISDRLESLSSFMEKNSNLGRISDMSTVASQSSAAAKRNYRLIEPCLENYDVLIQDEFAETLFSFLWEKNAPKLEGKLKRVITTDYVQFETGSLNPVNKIKIVYANRMLRKAFLNQDIRIFLDSEDALSENKNLRKWVRENFEILAPIIPSPPTETKSELVKKLFGQSIPSIVVFNLGGTAIGKNLAEFVINHCDPLSEELDSFLIVLLGSRIKRSDLPVTNSSRIALIPFTIEISEYYKTADCVVSQAGASSLYEIASLGVPCVSLPVSNHFEQIQNAKRFSKRFGFEILDYSKLTVANIKRAVVDAEKKKYEPLAPTKTAEDVAQLILQKVC